MRPLQSPMDVDLLIDDGLLLTMTDEAPDPVRGYLAIAEGKIVALEAGSPPPDVGCRRRINAGGGIVHPGLIDTHAHVSWGLARNWMLLSHSRADSFETLEIPLVKALQPRDVYLGVVCAGAEMLLNGTTTFADTGSSPSLEHVAEAVSALGMRGMIATFESDLTRHSIRDTPPRILRRIEENLLKFPKSFDAKVWACVGLLGGNMVSPGLLADAKELATEQGAVLNIHKASGATELAEQDPDLSLSALQQAGILDHRTILVHVNYVSEDDESVLANEDVAVVHCPATAKRYGLAAPSTRGRFPEMISRRMRVSLGTDAVIFSNTWSLFDQMSLAGSIHRDSSDRPLISGWDLLAMSTRWAADSIDRSDLGRLSLGASADLVIHSPDALEFRLGAVDPYEALAFSAGRSTVRHVMVAGESLVEDGEILNDEIYKHLESAASVAEELRSHVSVTSLM